MRTTGTLDDELLDKARQLTGIEERTALLRAAPTSLVEREAARRLAKPGGSEPQVEDVPRRRFSA